MWTNSDQLFDYLLLFFCFLSLLFQQWNEKKNVQSDSVDPLKKNKLALRQKPNLENFSPKGIVWESYKQLKKMGYDGICISAITMHT